MGWQPLMLLLLRVNYRGEEKAGKNEEGLAVADEFDLFLLHRVPLYRRDSVCSL